jgi:hypothetical protein
MRNVIRFTAFALLAIAGVAVQAARAQSGGPYRIERAVVAGGGRPAAAGTYQLSGTFGQSATATLQSAGYAMFDGFWSPVTPTVSDRIFANAFEP